MTAMPHAPDSTRAGWPWAGLLAVLVVLLLDRWCLSEARDWSQVFRRIDAERHLESGLAKDRMQLRKLDRLHPAYATAVVLGSSRAGAGFQFETHPKDVRARIGKLAHAGLNPLELRSMLGEIAEREPTVALLLLSEFDTHAPLRLVPHAMGDDLGAVWELAVATPPGFVFEHRTDLLRMLLVGVLNGYRFRSVLGAAGLDAGRHFASDERWPALDAERPLPALGRRVPMPREVELLIAEGGVFPRQAAAAIRQQASQLLGLAHGAQAEVQTGLVRALVAGLREAGARVVILEGPLHPLAAHLRQPDLRAEFLSFMEELVVDAGVTFVPLTEQPSYSPAEFGDLTHLNEIGARKLSDVALEQLTRAFEAQAVPGDPNAGR